MIALLHQSFDHILHTARQLIRQWIKPDNYALLANVAADLTRSKAELILENAFLRQQLIVLERQVNRPALKPREWVLLVLLASKLRTTWKQALLIVQPDTLQRCHRGIFRWLWKRKSRPKQRPGRPTMFC